MRPVTGRRQAKTNYRSSPSPNPTTHQSHIAFSVFSCVNLFPHTFSVDPLALLAYVVHGPQMLAVELSTLASHSQMSCFGGS